MRFGPRGTLISAPPGAFFYIAPPRDATSGAPVAMKLYLDMEGRKLQADGSDIVMASDMVPTAGHDGPGRVTSGNRAIPPAVFKTFEPSVFKLRKEFVVLHSRRWVLE